MLTLLFYEKRLNNNRVNKINLIDAEICIEV